MASIIRNKRRPKLVTPSNSSFSNCVQDQLFIQPIRRPLDTFKPVVYLDEQGRRHGRTSDHLLQRQIENDRQRLKKQPIPKVPVSSTLYGIRNPNIAALIRDVPIDNDDDDDERNDNDKLRADDEIKFIEYKKTAKPATSKTSNRQSVSGKLSVKFDTTPSVNMIRLAESHLTELDDIDNIDEDDIEDDDDDDDDDDENEDLESSKHESKSDSNTHAQTDKSADIFSETPSTSKNLDVDGENSGIKTNSTLDYNRQSQDIQMPPTVEDVRDSELEEKHPDQGESENELSSPEIAQRRKQSTSPSEKTEERLKSASSSRPKTAPSTRSRSENEEPKSSRASSSSSTASDDTSALLRSDNDNSPNLSDHEINNEEEPQEEEEEVPIETPTKSDHIDSNVNFEMNVIEQENISSPSTDRLQQRNIKGDYDTKQVIQLKESFQPIINEAASYGHLDIVRKLIECGQSVHTQNLLQRTPLHEACLSNNGQLTSELLDNGALIDQRDSQGMTPLHVAASHGTLKCVRILCEKGCDINAQDNLGQTAAHYSAMHDHVDVLKYLINVKHIDLSLSTNDSKLPIHYAAKHGSKNVLNYFFQSNLTIYVKDNHGNLITHEASEYNQLDCINFIWKFNRNLLKSKNNSGRTPMHTAALYGSTDVLHWLLELSIIHIDQPDNNGYTMAHLAASRGHGECFSCLITHNAQLDVYTFDRHESVLNIAKRSGKYGRIEQARSGTLRCHCCGEKLTKEKYDRTHARNAVEQLIHTQIQHGYNLNIPVNRSLTNLSQRNRSTS